MLPLALVTGFLGAGKTTFLAAYARRLAGRRIVFLVNEFAASDVDSPVLAASAERVVGVSGGSIFCRCKAGEFLNRLAAIPREHPDAEGVVVEASGMADPSCARSMLDESRLDRTYDLQGTIALADPGTLHKVLDTLPAAERQIAAADVVVLGKVDLHTRAWVEATRGLILGINPGVRIVEAVRGACHLDPLTVGSRRWVDGELSRCADISLVPVDAPCPAPVDADAVARAVCALGDGLHRAKGFLRTAAGWRHLDWSAGRLELKDSPPGPSGLALIVRPEARDAAEALAVRLRAGSWAA